MSGGAGRHLAGDTIAERPLGALPIVIGLETDPEIGARAEVSRQPQCRLGGNRALARPDGENSVVRHAQGLRQTIGAEPQLVHPLAQDLAGMHRSERLSVGIVDVAEVDAPGAKVFHGHDHPLYSLAMVISEPDIMGIAFYPKEADAPLAGYPDRPLSLSITRELLQPIARICGKVAQRPGAVELPELTLDSARELGLDMSDALALVQSSGRLVGKALDHLLYVARTECEINRLRFRQQ